MNGNELGSDARFQPVFDKGLRSETVTATGTDVSFIANDRRIIYCKWQYLIEVMSRFEQISIRFSQTFDPQRLIEFSTSHDSAAANQLRWSVRCIDQSQETREFVREKIYGK